VAIDSRNPTLVPGAPGEKEIGEYTSAVMQALGLEVHWYEPEPGRVSVVGRREGVGTGPSLMWNAHYDTVGVDGMEAPFAARVKDGRLHGRGAFDMKGSLAAQLAAVKALNDLNVKLRGDLLLAAVADEEYASLGTMDILWHYHPDAVIVTEPTGLDVCVAHKGFIWLKVTTLGRAAHGSRFDLGIDANMRMGRVLARLEQLERELRQRPEHHLLGPPSLHAATVHGGSELSAYAAQCELGIERRTVPGELAGDVVSDILGILDDLGSADSSFRAVLETVLIREPFESAPGSAIVGSLDAAVSSVTGNRPDHVGNSVWMDAALFDGAGIDTVVIGPEGGGAHADEEWVDMASVSLLAEILAVSGLEFCGRF
jgi:acetylornithine deacetylase